jgi:hypothetical protein
LPTGKTEDPRWGDDVMSPGHLGRAIGVYSMQERQIVEDAVYSVSVLGHKHSIMGVRLPLE